MGLHAMTVCSCAASQGNVGKATADDGKEAGSDGGEHGNLDAVLVTGVHICCCIVFIWTWGDAVLHQVCCGFVRIAHLVIALGAGRCGNKQEECGQRHCREENDVSAGPCMDFGLHGMFLVLGGTNGTWAA